MWAPPVGSDDGEVGVGCGEQAEPFPELGRVAFDGESAGRHERLQLGGAGDDLVDRAPLDAFGCVNLAGGHASAMGEDAVLERDGVLLTRVGEWRLQRDTASPARGPSIWIATARNRCS